MKSVLAVSILLALVVRPVAANEVGCYYYWVDWTFEALKPIADRYHAAGVTDFILHVVISQPGDDNAPPVRPWFGSFFDRRSKHAGEVKILVDYLKSLSCSTESNVTVRVSSDAASSDLACDLVYSHHCGF